jgi:hypothetical protein
MQAQQSANLNVIDGGAEERCITFTDFISIFKLAITHYVFPDSHL